MLKIDKKTYWIKPDSHYKTRLAKSQIVLGISLRKDHNHLIRLQNKDYKKTKTWNTYTISREGEVFQHYNDKNHTDFLGIKEVDKKSISIVLENMGALFKLPNNHYVNWLNEPCDKKMVVKKKWLGYEYWESFPEKQIENTIFLLRQLCETHGIPEVIIDFHHYHQDILKFRGIVFRSNYIEKSSDLTPMFEIEQWNEMLRNKFI